MKETRSIKIQLSTYRVLKVIAAKNGETLMALIDRLAQAEEGRVKQDAQKDTGN